MNKTIEERQAGQKEKLLKHLSEVPIVTVVCQKVGIGRSTYYRWRKEDLAFAQKTNQEMKNGVLLINDMAETNLITKIKEKDMTGIIFWLKHRHPAYSQKINITAQTNGPSIENADELFDLLYDDKTYRQGQKKLASYVLNGQVSQKSADYFLKSFISQLKADDVFSRKAETRMISEVLLRKGVKKSV